MSAATINRKIARGFAKVGKKLGYQFTLYRPDVYINPLEPRNGLLTAPMSWSKDEQFKANPEPTLAQYTIYCDFTVLKEGDIVHSAEINRTFIINEINQLRGAVSFQASDLFTVKRPTFDANADVKSSLVDIIVNMPGAIQYSNAKQSAAQNTQLKAAQSGIEVWTWLPVDSVQLGDVLEFNSKRFLISSVDTSAVGMKIRAESTKVGV